MHMTFQLPCHHLPPLTHTSSHFFHKINIWIGWYLFWSHFLKILILLTWKIQCLLGKLVSVFFCSGPLLWFMVFTVNRPTDDWVGCAETQWVEFSARGSHPYNQSPWGNCLLDKKTVSLLSHTIHKNIALLLCMLFPAPAVSDIV